MMLTDKGESAGAAALYNQAAAHGLFPDPFQRAPYLVAETIAAVAWPEMEHWPVLVKAKGVLEKGYPDIKKELLKALNVPSIKRFATPPPPPATLPPPCRGF